jgi:carbon storage regulator
MLVLSRKVGERVIIGEGIVVVVKRVSGQRVTFGIEAPNEIKIIRGELELFEKPQPMSPFAPELDAGSAVAAKPR